MNKIIAAIIGLVMIASPAFAWPMSSYASSQFGISADGMTTVKTQAVLDGVAGELQNVVNMGSLDMLNSVDFSIGSWCSPSSMVESTGLEASGNTYTAQAASWSYGMAGAYIGWNAGSASDAVEVDSFGSGSMGYSMQTNMPVTYVGSFAYNAPTDCDPEEPVTPTQPVCGCPFCPPC
jgi:hypothetical protein